MLLRPFLCLLLAMLTIAVGCESHPSSSALRLATTTSTRDSGLLDELLPPFERQHGVKVDVIAVGTGKALKLGEAGDADVVLVHARAAEDAFMAAGHGVRREDVMRNTFEIIGPASDPAGVNGLAAGEALERLAAAKAKFISRGDDSGTHKRELKLWKRAGGQAEWSEYIETGQGMGATLTVANEMQAYTLTDRGTFLNFKNKIDLVTLVAGDESLANPYGVMVVNPEKNAAINAKLANEFVDYLSAPETQRKIGAFRIHGEALFVPHRASSGVESHVQ